MQKGSASWTTLLDRPIMALRPMRQNWCTVTAAEMKEIDSRAIRDRGIPAARLMENAGKAVAGEVRRIIQDKKNVLAFCGYGNNGGDGLVAARHLAKQGYDVKVFFVGPARSFTPATNANLEKLLSLKVNPGFILSIDDIDKVFSAAKTNCRSRFFSIFPHLYQNKSEENTNQ